MVMCEPQIRGAALKLAKPPFASGTETKVKACLHCMHPSIHVFQLRL